MILSILGSILAILSVEVKNNQAYNWKFIGDYYFITKSTTFVQTCYVHNESIIGDKLSITIDKLGISITGGKTSYYGKGINVYVKD